MGRLPGRPVRVWVVKAPLGDDVDGPVEETLGIDGQAPQSQGGSPKGRIDEQRRQRAARDVVGRLRPLL